MSFDIFPMFLDVLLRFCHVTTEEDGIYSDIFPCRHVNALISHRDCLIPLVYPPYNLRLGFYAPSYLWLLPHAFSAFLSFPPQPPLRATGYLEEKSRTLKLS